MQLLQKHNAPFESEPPPPFPPPRHLEFAAPAAPPAVERKPDWGAIEREFADGVASIRDIARRHGVSDMAIRKHAKVRGLSRNGSHGSHPGSHGNLVPPNHHL
jgi:hypothetical protein